MRVSRYPVRVRSSWGRVLAGAMLCVLFGVTAVSQAAAGTLGFADNFSNLDKWNVSNPVGWGDFTPWKLDSTKYVSAGQSLSHTPYSSAENSEVTMKNDIDLTTAHSATLTFKAWYNTNPNVDYVYVKVYSNLVDEWGWPVNTTVARFTGSSGSTFQTETIDLTPFIGQRISVMFRLASSIEVADYWLANGGVRIDDVQVWCDGVGASTAPAGATLARTPSKSSISVKRKSGVARYTLSARARAADGSRLPRLRVRLQTSKNGKSGWKNAYVLTTDGNGDATKKFAVRKKGTTYYRWRVDAPGALQTTKQKVTVR